MSEHGAVMSTAATAHTCPRCELRFDQRGELLDHVRHDHPAPIEQGPTPEGRVILAVDPVRPDPGVAVASRRRWPPRPGRSRGRRRHRPRPRRRLNPGVPAGAGARMPRCGGSMGQLARSRIDSAATAVIAQAAGTPGHGSAYPAAPARRSARRSSAAWPRASFVRRTCRCSSSDLALSPRTSPSAGSSPAWTGHRLLVASPRPPPNSRYGLTPAWCSSRCPSQRSTVNPHLTTGTSRARPRPRL